MFDNEELVNYFKTSNTVSINSLITAEWNLNIPGVIKQIGNYRYRPTDENSLYKNLPINYDNDDTGDYYTDATLSYATITNTVNNEEIPQSFSTTQQKYLMHYSLESCFEPFRPRSGINKTLFFANRYLPPNNIFGYNRPRYYMSTKDDKFKYWTSYRIEGLKERGIANNINNGINVIEDACPFVVYNKRIPTNKIVIKLQTNVGSYDAGVVQTSTGTINDPFFSSINKTVPSRFKVQVLKNNTWVDIFSVIEGQTRNDGTDIFGADGYLELSYYNNQWTLSADVVNSDTKYVTDLVSPQLISNNSIEYYKEFEYIEGIRLAVYSMNKFDCSLDLIEMSPRLVVDISDRVVDFRITKSISDLGSNALPVGQLLASTGTLTLFNDDYAFSEGNQASIVKEYIDKNIKFSFYENIYNDEFSYLVPIKTLYVDGLPQTSDANSTVSLFLRDFFFYFESQTAPRMLLSNVSLSYAISVLLDSIGFSNYSFKRMQGETDTIIPYFFVAPNQNIAEVLNQLAISTQSAMFFDEYNNFIVMSKRYMLPDINERVSNFSLIGTNDQYQDNLVKNQTTGNLPNIIDISAENKKIYNDGKINYTSRYIQRQYGSINQANLVDQDKTWVYKPVLLWEVSGDETTKTINQQVSKQGKYVLGAMPLNSDLSDQEPLVVDHILTNNIIDVGENIYYLTRYKGYLYSSGEIIKYDAAEFNVAGTGNVWIESNQQYQNYFANLPFGGKMYPTGNLRIFCTPYYETVDGITQIKNGKVLEHGRAQFGTNITYHNSGVSQYWTNNESIVGCNMKSQYLFTTEVEPSLPATEIGIAGRDTLKAKESTKTGIIKNFLSNSYFTETQLNELKSTQTGTIQSSALVFSGPSFKTDEKPIDFISYVYKPLDNSYKHFGTRARIVGKVDNSINKIQTPYGSTGYYQIAGNTPDQNVSIGGGSGGLAVLVNPENNNGYYFEIAALTEKNLDSYIKTDDNGQSTTIINNVLFYKIKKESGSSSAIPIKLWGGIANILVDDGKFTGQYRIVGEENPTVYDMSVEYVNIGKTRRFFLYLDNKLIATVDDTDPLPAYNNMALFVRGSSRCMFEHVYALNENYSQNTVFNVAEPLSSTFGDKEINASEALRKYAMSGMIQSTYLSGISSQQSPKYNIYFEEFGTIMRECAYFNIKYDKAYPALYAQLSPTFNRIKGYTTSGFYSDAYGAEFLIFNATDSALNLDETTGNYLRIQGITFTQDTTYQLTVDDYFNKVSTISSLPNSIDNTIRSPLVELQTYNQIKQSRLNYGLKDFTIDAPYIQQSDDAENLLGWIIGKSMTPKKVIGANIFATPILQLGDIVNIEYIKDGVDIIGSSDKQFVIYHIEYERTSDGPAMTVYMVEV